MNRKIVALIMVFSFVFCMTACNKSQTAIEKVNKALEKSLKLEEGSILTTVTQGQYYKEELPDRVEANFKVNEPSKDKGERNIQFDVLFVFGEEEDRVENITNYEGLYLNVYYPFPKYNTIKSSQVDHATVEKIEGGKEYYIYYKDSHVSRRIVWEYCEVEADYEYFRVDEKGVIVEYKSDITFKYQDENTSEWKEDNSIIHVELKDYKLL